MSPVAQLKNLKLSSLSRSEQNPMPGDTLQSHPLSFGQRRLWFIEQLQPGEPVYNLPEAWRIEGPLNITAFERSIGEMIRRHASLRTAFAMEDSEPVQRVQPFAGFSLDCLDLRAHADAEQEARRLLELEVSTPFDLGKGPLFRARLLHVSDLVHIAVFNAHHIIWDGWSIEVFRNEMAALYEAFSQDKTPSLPELPMHYTDFARQQREWSNGELWREQLSYWKQQLRAPLPVLELPSDRPRSANPSFRGATEFCSFDKALIEPLRALSRKQGVTLFMTLLAAFKVLLQRYSRQDDILVASPITGRNETETQGVIGFFVNTLVLRTSLAGDPKFTEFLARIRQTTLNAYTNGDMPFERVVQEVHPERSLNHNPLFQVLFGFERTTRANWSLPGLSVRVLDIDTGTAKFDWTFLLQETDQAILGSLEYSTELFDAASIRRVLAHYRVLIEAIAADASRRLSELPLLDSQERETLLRWSNPSMSAPAEQCVHALFEAQVERTPNALAVECNGEKLTYSELNCRANHLANQLRECGVGPDTPVGLCLERSADLAIAVLAVHKAGGAYVPLDSNYPQDRLRRMLEISAPPVLVTRTRSLRDLPPLAAKLVLLDQPIQVSDAQADSRNPDSGTRPDHLAYVIFTSGSTGIPKGVAMPHRPLANLIRWQLRNFSGPAAARTLQFASPSFDVSFQEMFSTWCAGGTLVLAPEEARRDPNLLWRFIRSEKVERLFLPFVALQQLAEAAAEHSELPQSLREIITAGEQLRVTPQISALFQRLPHCALSNQYGPSETHVVTAFTLQGAAANWPTLPPIGTPIANTQAHILDERLQLAPIGVPGELYLAGDCLARGYLHRPDLTADRFIANPFHDLGSERMYRTGDVARWLPDGTIEFLGRADAQLKIRGFRIEPGEIETTLLQHQDVHEAVVIGHDNEKTRNKELVAYVVARGNSAPSDSELRAFLESKLPDYMVPAHFEFLESIPLSPNGKVDRRALPAPNRERTRSQAPAGARNATDQTLLEIWTQVLGEGSIGIHDNFFELGGHSLLATQVVSRIGRALGIELPVRALFETPTIAALSDRIAQIPRGASTKPALAGWRARRSEARQLLARIDQLSEAEIDSLLRTTE